MPAAVLVPVKDFRQAKRRLAQVLDPEQRATLAQAMAERVLAAAAPLPAFVVCDDREVARWAETRGATVLWRPGRGLNGAVRDGVQALADSGFGRVVVAHADLPLARSLAWAARPEGVTIVPDRHDDGTNVIALPSDVRFTFAYGRGSYRRHAREARRLGLAVRVVRDRELGWDVDLPDDLDHPGLEEVRPSTPTSPASRR